MLIRVINRQENMCFNSVLFYELFISHHLVMQKDDYNNDDNNKNMFS